MNYTAESVIWVVDQMTSFDMTPYEVIRVETEYPGLLADIDHVIWMKQLIQKDMDNRKPKSDLLEKLKHAQNAR